MRSIIVISVNSVVNRKLVILQCTQTRYVKKHIYFLYQYVIYITWKMFSMSVILKLSMDNTSNGNSFVLVLKNIWLENIPSYANKIFYSLGFLSMICLFLLVITGSLLAFFGPDWWLSTQVGGFTRSVHLWSVQAFVVFVILHVLIVFLTGGYRAPRQLLWVIGGLMFFFALMEAEFGYVLRSDFSSQWRSLQGADLYNGSGLGKFINNLNYAQIFGIHVIIIPLIIFGLLFLHYAIVRIRGIAVPYKKEFPYKIVKANHTILFVRGLVLVLLIIILSFIFPSPLIAPISIKQLATIDPTLMAKTLVSEIDHSSDTATYMDTIDPYQFDTTKIYIEQPYLQSLSLEKTSPNLLVKFEKEDKKTQDENLQNAKDYFEKNGTINSSITNKNPIIPIVSLLTLMGKSGLYEAALHNESDTGYNPTYTLRFLSDTGVLEDKATGLGITTPQYGMLREEKGFAPGAWWLAPLGLMDNTILSNDDNQDRDGALILGTLMLLFLAFPYIPILNNLPDKLGVYKFIWKDKKLQNQL